MDSTPSSRSARGLRGGGASRPWSPPARLLVAAAVLSLASGCGRSDLLDPGASAGVGGHAAAGSGGSTGRLPELPPTPGLLLCGSALCTTSSQQCCLGVGASGGLAASCQSTRSTCQGASLQCDEPADCPASDVCCFGLLTAAGGPSALGLTLGSRCGARASCAGVGQLILCRKDSDCGAGGGVCCPGLGVPTCQATCSSL